MCLFFFFFLERLRDWLSSGQVGATAPRSLSRVRGGLLRAHGTRAEGGEGARKLSQRKLNEWVTVGPAGSGIGEVVGGGQEVARGGGRDGRTATRKTRQARWKGR